MKILIDNGHGSNTSGKRSPDGKFLEYQYNRIIATRVVSELVDCGYDAELLVPEETDIPLRERVRRVNDKCDIYGVANVILVSIHVNAAGSDGKWHKATGWSAYTTPGITKSDLLAFDLYEAARKNLPGKVIRQFNGPQEPDFEENFYILKHTKCPAVLTENFFMDNVDDVRFLNSRAGMDSIINLHFEGITTYFGDNHPGISVITTHFG